MEQTSFHQENFRRRTRYTAVFLILAAVFCVVTVLNINTGNVHIPVPKILRILFLKEGAATEYNIIWKIRLPRILMAALLGGALSLSGFLLQTFFSNPIAGPFVLGISSGAKMVVALTMIVYLKYIGRFSSYTLILAAFIGSLISTGFILLMSKKVQHMASLLVGGIMIGYICSAITDFVVTFADDSDIVNLHGWSQGSFSGMSWSNIRVAAVVVGLAVLFTFFLSKPISAYQLGEAYAQSMGRQHQDVSRDFDLAFQYSVSVCDSICGTDFLRGNRSSVSCKEGIWNVKTDRGHTGNVLYGSCVLYDL